MVLGRDLLIIKTVAWNVTTVFRGAFPRGSFLGMFGKRSESFTGWRDGKLGGMRNTYVAFNQNSLKNSLVLDLHPQNEIPDFPQTFFQSFNFVAKPSPESEWDFKAPDDT